MMGNLSAVWRWLRCCSPLCRPRRTMRRDRRTQDEPGQFDFYVLSLSWSPSFCAEAAERHARPLGRRAMRGAALFLRRARAVAAI